MITGAVIAIAIGILLALLGRRGRRLDEHPVCAVCRFDLSGINPSHPQQSCPECGSHLVRSGAIRTGNRRRIRSLVVAGAVCASVSSVYLAVSVIRWADREDWGPLKPESWLEADAQSGNVWREDAALKEAERRLSKGRSSTDLNSVLIDLALARQADRDTPWSDAWADFLDAAMHGGKLSTAQLTAYGRAAIFLSVGGTPTATDGSLWPLSVSIGGGRASRRARFSVLTMVQRVDIDGFAQGPLPIEHLEVQPSGGGGAGGHDLPIKIRCPPGKRTAHITCHFEVRERIRNAPVMSSWSEEFSFPLEVLPARDESGGVPPG